MGQGTLLMLPNHRRLSAQEEVILSGGVLFRAKFQALDRLVSGKDGSSVEARMVVVVKLGDPFLGIKKEKRKKMGLS